MSFSALWGRPLNAFELDSFANHLSGYSCFEDETVWLASSEPGDWGDAVHNLNESITDIRLVGRARIYNLTQLAAALSAEPDELSTSQLLIAAYRKWGSQLATYLIGDFSCVFWDRSTSRLLALRDHFGVRPLFYRRIGESVLVSDSERDLGIKATSPVTRSFVDAFLTGTIESGLVTAHPGVKRVLPGHQLEVDQSGETILPYWTLKPAKLDMSQPVRGFRERFEAAVTSRIREHPPVACMLSGGLDSSAIAGVLRKRLPEATPIMSYSMVYAQAENSHLDETTYIETITKRGGYRSNYICVDEYRPLENIQAMLKQQLGPYLAPGLAKTQGIFAKLQCDKVRFIFDGHGGDEVVWYGSSRIMELAARGSWASALALLPTHARLFGDNPFALGALLFIHYAPAKGLGRLMRRLARFAFKKGLLSLPRSNWRTYLSETVLTNSRRALAPELTPLQRADDQSNHLAALTSPRIGYAFEVLDKASTSFGVEVIYPFFDRALAEYCVTLPSSEKLRRDGTRSILRRALRDVVPRRVLRRRDKTDFRSELLKGLTSHHRAILLALRDDAGGRLAPYVNSVALPNLITRALDAPSSVSGDEVLLLWRIACLYCWLDMGGTVVDEALDS